MDPIMHRFGGVFNTGLVSLAGSSGSSTSHDCLSDLSCCDESSRDCCCEYPPCGMNKRSRRQNVFTPMIDEHSLTSCGSDVSCCKVECSHVCGSAMDEVEQMSKGSFLKDALRITIPTSNYFIFPSDLPKEAIVECIQAVFDSILFAFHSRFDRDKRAWAVYSTYPANAARFKIHIYEFDGITHVEMRAESGCEDHGAVVFRMLQSAVGRLSQDAEPLPSLDSYFETVSGVVPLSDHITDRDMRRNIKALVRTVQSGSVQELESACLSLLQATLFDELLPILSDCLPALLHRLLTDNIVEKLMEPVSEPLNIISGLKSKGSLRASRQRGYSTLPKSEWNAYVRATDVLRRLSTSEDCLCEIVQTSYTISFMLSFIASALDIQKAFLMRRNIMVILFRISIQKPDELLMAGLTEPMCRNWLSPESAKCALSDPQFVEHVRNLMQNLDFAVAE